MSRTKLPRLNSLNRQQIINTITTDRLKKYLIAAYGDEQQALKLYVLNAKVSAALLIDIHYVEVALRNKFHHELANGFNSPYWFSEPAFTTILNGRGKDILAGAAKAALKTYSGSMVITAIPPGKMIAELTIGFWLSLMDKRFTTTLWTPYLHKAFACNRAPSRSTVNQMFEKIRQLRNRVAHHESLLHMNLVDAHRNLCDAAQLLCPATAMVMISTSSVKREIMTLSRYRGRKGI